MKLQTALFLVVFMSLLACKDTELKPELELLGYEYFPTNLGSFVEYEVKQTDYTPNNPPKNSQYQLREVVTETYTDVENNIAYRLERWKRPNANSVWLRDSIWTTTRNKYRGIRNENNITFLKLVFPLAEGLRWDGNAYNSFGENEYSIENLDKPLTINTSSFSKTLKVVQADDSSLVFLNKRYEIYAPNVGMVEKYTKKLNYCTDIGCIGLAKIEFGIIKSQKIINYGKSF